MRLAAAVARLLSEELATEECLQHVAVARVQATGWDWVTLSVWPTAEKSARTLVSALAPLRAGELILAAGDALGFYSPRGVIAQAVTSEDPTVRGILSESPGEVQRCVREREERERVIFARLARDGSLSDAHGLVRIVGDTTWFGLRSLPAGLRGRHVGFALGAQTADITTLDCDPIAACQRDDIHIAFFSSVDKPAVTVRVLSPDGSIERLGLSGARVAEALGVPLSRYYGFDVRLPLEVEVVSTYGLVDRRAVLEAMESCRANLRAARAHCEDAIDAGIDTTISLLEERRRRATGRAAVVVVDKAGISHTIGSVPTNEHEVLILVGKLETHIGRVLPVFRIWEHTSLVGIDALADIQLSRESVPVRKATVEFEYQLENFFRHVHPIRQTEFVVCWSTGRLGNGRHSYGDGRVDAGGELVFEMRGDDWIRILDFREHLIRVLVLEDLPGLRVVGGA